MTPRPTAPAHGVHHRTRPTVPARVFADRATAGRRGQHRAEQYADGLGNLRCDQTDLYAAELIRTRVLAAELEAAGWELYAKQNEACFQSAADREMRAADHLQGLAPCPHGCCPVEVCQFTEDCETHDTTAFDTLRDFQLDAAIALYPRLINPTS